MTCRLRFHYGYECCGGQEEIAARLGLPAGRRGVLQYRRMSHTITVRLTPELAAWLRHASATTGVSQGRIIREQLEQARDNGENRAFMYLAGAVRGPRDLSSRKGFSTE